MNDQRKEERRKLMAFTPVYNSNKRTLLGYIGDLTLKGVMVIGKNPVETKQQITLIVELSNDLYEIASDNFTIPARVAWCRQDAESSQDFNIGLEFTEINPQNKLIIQAILERYHFRHHMSDPEFKEGK